MGRGSSSSIDCYNSCYCYSFGITVILIFGLILVSSYPSSLEENVKTGITYKSCYEYRTCNCSGQMEKCVHIKNQNRLICPSVYSKCFQYKPNNSTTCIWTIIKEHNFNYCFEYNPVQNFNTGTFLLILIGVIIGIVIIILIICGIKIMLCRCCNKNYIIPV